jgi:predicted ATPase
LGLRVCAYHAIGNAALCLGRFAEGLDHFEQGTAVYDVRHHAHIVGLCGQDSGVVCRAFRGWPLWFLGYPDQARKRLGEGAALANQLAHPLTTVTYANIACWTYPLLRDAPAALREAELAIALCDEHRFEFWRAMAVLAQGWALTEQGMLDDAITRLRAGLTSLRQSGGEIMLPYYISTLADALRKAGRTEEALTLLAEAEAIPEQTGEVWWEPELLRMKAEILLEPSRPQRDDEAEALLRKAVNLSHEQNAKSLELRSATSLGHLLLRRGQKSEACRTVSAVYTWFTEGFDTPDLREAKALVHQSS